MVLFDHGRAGSYTLNVNPDATLKVTNLWINVQVRNAAGMPLGLVGTGMQLDRFLRTMLAPRSAGAMSFIIDGQGRIVAHPDPDRIEYGAMGKQDTSRTVFAELSEHSDQETFARALAETGRRDTQVLPLQVETEQGTRMMALAHLPGTRLDRGQQRQSGRGGNSVHGHHSPGPGRRRGDSAAGHPDPDVGL